MRHRNKATKLNRNSSQRYALLKGLSNELFVRESITTTSTKAKWIQPFVDRFISHAKSGTVATRRHLARFLPEETVQKLVTVIAPRFGSRASGFTTSVVVGHRRGDNSAVVKLSLINQVAEPVKDEKVAKKASKKSDTNA